MGPQGHSGSSLKNNILPGGAPETARRLKAKEPYERKDTDICEQGEKERKRMEAVWSENRDLLSCIARRHLTNKATMADGSYVCDTSPSHCRCQIVTAAGVVILPPGLKL